MALDFFSSVTSALERDKLIPDVLPEGFQPTILFSVQYPNKTEALLGNELVVEDTVDEPSIVITPLSLPQEQATSQAGDASGDISYTLVMLDPDAPSHADPIYGQFRHWVVTGLKTPLEGLSSTSNLTTLLTMPSTTPYRPPGPRPASGLHRYTFLLFQEPASTEPFAIPAGAAEHGAALEERRKWNALEFGRNYGLKLVGANFFLIRAD
ncbi:PEBP-like protein [Gloeopeniophorella convolvens]|nr:PEBP-like protein [Gloeopeniophorella convolvens]